MTDNEIIKALECLTGEQRKCKKCAYNGRNLYPFCREHCAKDALDLINRQRAEIERLERKIEDLESVQEISPEAKHFIDTKADKVISLMNELIKSQEQIKAEAVKEIERELADRLVDVAVLKDNGDGTESLYIRTWDVRKILKEMVGEQK